jgi:hypothetical protein
MAKKLLLAAVAIAIVQCSLYAQQISLSGYVRDAKTRQGIEGARVALTAQTQVFAVTDSVGHYAITGDVGVRENSTARKNSVSPCFINNALSFSVPASGTVVRVDAFNLAGRFIATLFNTPCDAGDYSLRPSLTGFSCQVYVLKVQIGSVTSLLAMQMQNREKNRGVSFLDKTRGSNAKQGLLKKTASVDILIAAAPGYDTGYQTIPSYTGTANFLLDKELVFVDSVNYTKQGNFIIVSHAYQISRYSYCSGNSLSEYFDTIQPGYDTTEYANSGDSLWLIMPPETTYSSYTAYQTELVFLRNGTGTGLVGKWGVCGIDYRILSGSFSTTERQSLDSSNATMVAMYDSMGMEYVFTGAMVKLGYRGGYNYATSFITSWNSPSWNGNPADSALYDISVAALSNTKVRLTGRKSGEIVTIVWTAGSAPDQTYTSSNPAHAPNTYFQNPTACPDNPEPDWWSGFLSDNEKTGLLKRLAKTASGPAAPGLTVMPAKKMWYKAFRIIQGR